MFSNRQVRQGPSYLLVAHAILLVCSLLLSSESLLVVAQQTDPGTGQNLRLTSATGVRVRQSPTSTAPEMSRLNIGVKLRVLEQSSEKELVGKTSDFWYRIAAPDGTEGWVFGGLTVPFDPQNSSTTYIALAADRLKIEEASFAERADLYRFLDRVVAETLPREKLAEVELLRLLALHQSLVAMPLEKLEDATYKEWTTEHEARIVYSEPAGQWYVRSDLFWALEKKYRGLGIAERIAWEASRIPLPGECEGYLPCYISYHRVTDGEYLKLYPSGAHAGDALTAIDEFVDGVLEDLKRKDPIFEVPAEDRVSFRKDVTELRSIVATIRHAKVSPALTKLDRLKAHFR